MFIANRKKVEYTDKQRNSKWIHFPACDKGDPGTDNRYRYLGQVSTFVWFKDTQQDNELRRVMRDHIHLLPELFEYASHIISKLGLFKYAALHVRRNELQYKNSFISAEKTLQHVKPLIKPNEIIYISTDETDANFFKVIENEYDNVYQWKHFFKIKNSPVYIGDDIKIPKKYEGCVEMIVCGAARIFFGTDTSTFTAYITRLRGYINSPDKHTYHHNEQWSGNLKNDAKKYEKLWGTVYMDEFPEMWDKIRDTY